ncbi:MAG: DUF4199 domain-containing protein [Sphingomonadales bacterium]|nr:MAG: DUF4199 domain-containing protein [Sphingomonadales bacterium]
MTVGRYAAIYGGLAGLVILALIITTFALHEQFAFTGTMWFGYLVMVVVMAPFTLVGVKRYRDIERGGVIGFWRALGVGLAIAGVATLAYAVVWEGYLALTGYRFMDDMIASAIAKLHADGVTGAALADKLAELEWMREAYKSRMTRLAFTVMEISPVALVLPFVSAAMLRNPQILPAR